MTLVTVIAFSYNEKVYQVGDLVDDDAFDAIMGNPDLRRMVQPVENLHGKDSPNDH